MDMKGIMQIVSAVFVTSLCRKTSGWWTVFSFKNGRRLQSATHFIFHTKTSGVSHFSGSTCLYFAVMVVFFPSLFHLSVICLLFAYCFAVGFYGKEKSTDVNLPIKTDHDTLREGYRYAFVFCSNGLTCLHATLWLMLTVFHLLSPFDAFSSRCEL